MKYTYNEAEALKEHEVYEKTLKKAHCTHIAFGISAIIGIALVIAGSQWNAAAATIAGGVMLIPGIIGICLLDPDYCPPEPPAVIFLQASKRGKVLGTKIKKLNRGWHSNVPYVFVQIELPDGTVEDIELCCAQYKQSTRCIVTTFDVNKGIVYTPYPKEDN